jgi:RNA-directed DNA polymerase
MTEIAISTGASSARALKDWSSYPWLKLQKHAFRLQVRIAKAERERKRGKVKGSVASIK